jgi:hypothetical protein
MAVLRDGLYSAVYDSLPAYQLMKWYILQRRAKCQIICIYGIESLCVQSRAKVVYKNFSGTGKIPSKGPKSDRHIEAVQLMEWWKRAQSFGADMQMSDESMTVLLPHCPFVCRSLQVDLMRRVIDIESSHRLQNPYVRPMKANPACS